MLLIRKVKFVLIINILFLLSCSGSVPQIGQIIWQVNYLKAPEDSKIIPSLSLFILIDDEDGISDLDNIYIIHDESELFWKLDNKSWSMKTLGGKNWLGSNMLTMNDNSYLPDGKYRIMVIDKAGERDLIQIHIPASMLNIPKNIIFPKLIIESEIIVESNFSDNSLRIYDQTMKLLKNFKIEKGKINKSIILDDTNNKAYWVSLYSFNEDTGTGLIRGPYIFAD